MSWLLACAAAMALLATDVGQANAGIIFVATLTTSQENPPTVPLDDADNPRAIPFGFATLELNDAMTALTYSITVFNMDFGRVPANGTPVPQAPNPNPNPQTPGILRDDLIVAHIHRAPVGVNGPVVFGFIGLPFDEGTDGGANDVVVTPFAPGIGGTVTGKWDAPEGNGNFLGSPTTLTNQLPSLLAGELYLNFHTAQFPGGEIRGQIQAVPEPSTLTLGGFGLLAGLCAAWRRRKRSASAIAA